MSGNDTIAGGLGDDIISGSAGSTYVFNVGDGSDNITHTNIQGLESSISFGANIDSSGLNVIQSGGNLEISLNNSTDKITVENYFNSDTSKIDKLVFTDGSEKLISDYFSVVNRIDGTSKSDYLIGTPDSDQIYGYAGHDFINSRGGDDFIDGGSGNDFINGSTGSDIIYGGSGRDFINSGSGNDTVYGGSGCDFINSGSGDDIINGESSNDFINSGRGNDTINGGSGKDYIRSGRGNDIINGGTGKDYIYSGSGNDIIKGESGKDRIYAQSGDDIIDGGADKDYLNGSTGSDTYIFGLGDGKDYITDRDYNYNNTDIIAFNDDVLQEDIAIFIEGRDLKIDYGQNDLITVNKQTKSAYGVEEIRLDDGSYLTDNDLNLLVQDLTAFASNNGINLSNVQDVKNNEDLMNIVMNAWQS